MMAVTNPISTERGTARPPRVVLVVDDEPTIRLILCRLLRRLGYDVIEAADGSEALAALEAHPGIDGVVTDIRMPRMNGLELVHSALRQERRPRAYVLCTGDPSILDDARQALPIDVTILSKPFTTPVLGNALVAAFAAADSRVAGEAEDSP